MKVWPFARRRHKRFGYTTDEALEAIRTILNTESEHALVIGASEPAEIKIDATEKLLRIGWVLALLKDERLAEAMAGEVDNRIMLSEIQPAIKPDAFADIQRGQ